MNYNTDDYRAKARHIFDNVVAAFEQKAPDKVTNHKLQYWHCGTTFDTMTDYLLLLKESTVQEDKGAYAAYKSRMAKQFKIEDWTQRVDPFAQYLRTMITNKTACCYDDFSWWGIASAKASVGSPYYDLFIDLFGEVGTKNFQNAAAAIWELVYNGNYQAMIDSIVNLTSTDPKVNPNPYPLAKDYPGFADNYFVNDYTNRYQFHGGSSNAWERVKNDIPAEAKGAFSNLDGAPASQMNVEPRFEGGLWQYDYYYNSKNPTKEPSKLTGDFPSHCAQNGNPAQAMQNHYIGPYQLTLMNGLGLIFASRMYAWSGPTKDESLRTAANSVQQFIENWINFSDHSDANKDPDAYFWQYDASDNSKALIRERVGSYKDGGVVPGYEMVIGGETILNKGRRVWCGDQGLILGGLVAYQEIAPNGNSSNEYIGKLLNGTLDINGPLYKDFNEGTSFAGLQHFSPNFDASDWQYHLFRLEDYWTGAGIFWRYLFQTYRTNPAVKSMVGNILKEKDNIIFNSAETAASSYPKGPNNPWSKTPWDEEATELIKWFNPLATLTAAIEMMEGK